MAKQPLIPPPDTIDPRAPAEAPPPSWPGEQERGAPELEPPVPDRIQPDPGLPEGPGQAPEDGPRP